MRVSAAGNLYVDAIAQNPNSMGAHNSNHRQFKKACIATAGHPRGCFGVASHLYAQQNTLCAIIFVGIHVSRVRTSQDVKALCSFRPLLYVELLSPATLSLQLSRATCWGSTT
eukprot:scaffold3859_cov362-Prasinococcus_capsulatus_cf.AAC.2